MTREHTASRHSYPKILLCLFAIGITSSATAFNPEQFNITKSINYTSTESSSGGSSGISGNTSLAGTPEIQTAIEIKELNIKAVVEQAKQERYIELLQQEIALQQLYAEFMYMEQQLNYLYVRQQTPAAVPQAVYLQSLLMMWWDLEDLLDEIALRVPLSWQLALPSFPSLGAIYNPQTFDIIMIQRFIFEEQVIFSIFDALGREMNSL